MQGATTLTTDSVVVRTRARERLPLPAAVSVRRIVWFPAIFLVGYHLLALLAFVPWFFSWTGVILLIVGDYVFGVLGINLCYHRLLAHRGFRWPKWLEPRLPTLRCT